MAFHDIRVNHPTEEIGMEVAADRVALGLGRDRTPGTEHWRAVLPLEVARLAAPFRQAPIDVLVPPRHAEGNAIVEPVEARVLGHRVHRADQLELAVRAT